MDWAPVSQRIWDMKYRFRDPAGDADADLEATWWRVARALAAPERDPELWAGRFHEALAGFKFLPAGRVIAGAGTGRSVTLFNCFVMGTIPDDMSGIFENLREAALTMQQGGGIGHDFSTLRPQGAPVMGVGADASGPLSFMDVWDSMCRTIMSAGSRRGAMMATLRCDHPDIEAFVDAKRDPRRLRMFNVSVLVTDAFMKAVKDDADWDLVFEGKTYRTIKAGALWERIMRATYDYAEPGVIFIDRVNRRNNLHYCESINCSNPCGEQPLPPYGACLLGSINLAALVKDPFTPQASLDMAALERLVPLAVRMLDNVVDVSRFPLPQQEKEAKAKRRIGLGVTGLAVMGSNIARNFAHHGYTVALHNRSVAKTDALLKEHGDEGKFVRSETIEEFLDALEKPRRVLIMVKAGKPVDEVIDELLPHLEEGDIIIDGGNSLFTDTIRREKAAREKGLNFVGTGISGGGAALRISLLPSVSATR